MEDEIIPEALNRHLKAEELLANMSVGNGSTRTNDETLRLIHELEVHQIELEMQNEELKLQITEKDISELATEKYRTFYDFATTDYFSINREGEIKELNLSAARKLGKERSQLINSRFGFFLTEESKSIFNLFLEKLFNDSQKAACELSLLIPDKRTVYYHVTGIHSITEQLCFLSAIDISERKETEKFREMKREILQILNEPGTIKNAVHQALTILKSYTGFDAISIRLQDNNDYPYLDQSGFSNEFMLSENSILEFDKQGNVCRDKKGNPRLGCTCGLVISGKDNKSNPFFTAGGSWWTNNSLSILDLQAKDDARFQPRNICIHEGYASVALVPIRNNNTIVGLIQFNDKRKNCLNRNTIEVLEGIASHVGAAIMRKQAEDTLRKNEEFLRTITENAPDIIIELNREGAIQYMNRPMTGYEPEECLGRHFTEWALAEYHELMNRSLRLVFEEGETQTFLSRGEDKNEKIHWHRSSISPVKDGPIVKNAILITRDITESIITEEILKDSEEKQNAIILSAMDGFYITDRRGCFLEVNDTYCQMSGFIRSELLTMRIHDVVIKEKAVEITSHIQSIVEQVHDRFESQHRKKDGSVFEVEVSVQFKPVDGGRFVTFVHDISERKKRDLLLRQSEERQRLLSETMLQGVVHQDTTGKIISMNPAAERILGKTREQFLGSSSVKVEHDTIREDGSIFPGNEHPAMVTLQTGSSFQNVIMGVFNPNRNEYRWISIDSVPLFRTGEKLPYEVYTIFEDITERKKAEEAIAASEKEFRLLTESMPQIVWTTTAEGQNTYFNHKWTEYTGLTLQESYGNGWNKPFHPEDQQLAWDAWQNAVQHNAPYMIQCRLRRYDGVYRWWLMHGVPVIDKNGTITKWYGTCTDIDEMKNAGDLILQNEELLRSVIENVNSGVALIDDTGKFVVYNPVFLTLFGLSPDSTIKNVNDQDWSQWQVFDENKNLLHVDDHPVRKAAMTKKVVKNQLVAMKFPSGIDYIWMMISAEPLLKEDGTIDKIICTYHDITDSKQAEELIKESGQRYKSLFQDNYSVMLLIQPETGEIIDANPTACNYYGWVKAEICAMKISDINMLSQQEVLAEIDKAKQEERNHFFFRHRLASGEIRDVEVYSGPIRFGEAIMLYSLVHDITDRKKAEEALLNSERKLAEIYSTMSEGLAIHELVFDDKGLAIDYIITEVNPAYEKITGLKLGEEKGRKATERYEVEKAPFIDIYAQVEATGKSITFESYFPPIDKYFDISAFTPGKGKFVTIFRDISKQKLSEELLCQSEEKFRNLVFDMEVGVLLNNPKSEIILANPKAMELLGLTEDEITGKTPFDPDWRPIHEDGSPFPGETHPAAVVIATRKAVKNVVMGIYQPLRGDHAWFLINAQPQLDDKGKLLQVVTTFVDISDLREAQRELKESELRLKFHFENSPLGVVEWDNNFVVTQWSVEAEKIFGYTKEESIGKPVGDLNLIYEEDLPIVNHAMQRLTSGEEDTVVSSNRNVTKSGSIITAVWYNSILFDEKGEMKSVMSLVQDITAKKQAEEALMESEYLFRESQRAAFIGSYKTNFMTGHWESSEVMDQIFGIDTTYEKSVEGWLDIIHPDDRELMNQYLQEEVVGKMLPFNKEYRILRKNDGEMRWIHGMGKVGFDESNNLNSLVGTIQDIHDRKLKEEALRKMNKTLAALSKSSQIMAQSTEEADYLNKVCDIVVEDADFAMVWIGYAEEDEAKTIKPVASAGFNDNYLDTVKVSWADNEYGRGPTGVAIRTGKIAMCNNMLTDPDFKPWREQALKRGYAASIVFPLLSGDKAFGAITIYSKEPDSFLEDEIKLLSKLASDLAHGIITLRLRKAHELWEEKLRMSHDSLEIQVNERTAELVEINRTLSVTEEKYRTVADFTYNMETWMDASGKYIYVSPSCYKITGYTVDEFMNDPNLFVKIAHPDDREMVENHFKEDMKGTVLKGALEFRIITKSGMERWIGHSCQPVYNTDGMLLGQRGSNRNITKQKNAELVLIESEKNLRALTQRIDEVAEEERIRISREIHDEIGHLLTALKYDTEGLINHTNLSAEQVKEELTGMISMIEALIDSVRKIATDLRPGILDHMGLLAALEWKIKQFRLKNKICCEYHIEEMDVQFTKNETTFIYRILQEIITNVTRHSKATHMWVSINNVEGLFIMKVTDNGIGFDVKSSLQKGSLGLMGMIERAKSIGGEIHIECEPGKGTTTTFILKK